MEDFCEGRYKCGELNKESACSVILYSNEPIILTDDEGLKEVDSVINKAFTGVYRLKLGSSNLFFVLINEDGTRELWRKTGKGVEVNSAYVLMEGELREVRKEVICLILSRMSF